MRVRMLHIAAIALLSYSSIAPPIYSAPPSTRGALRDAVSPEQWLDDAILKKGLKGTLHLSRFVEPIYFLTKPIEWIPNASQTGLRPVVVPTGFVTDLASIPPIFFFLLRPDGTYAHAAIIHDYLYWSQNVSREDADSIFKTAMEDLEVDPVVVAAIVSAVSAFGESSWRTNAKLRVAGEKRVLRVFPEDPRTRWVDWKRRPDVFE